MAKIQGKDFAKTVVITPEENEALKHKAEAAKEVKTETVLGGEVKGPPKGLSGWSVFFLVLIIAIGLDQIFQNRRLIRQDQQD